MAKKNSEKKEKKSKSSGGSVWSLNKIAFWSLTVIAVMYLLAGIFHFVGVEALANAAGWIQAVATAVALCLVSVLAYRYIRHKPVVWLVLYILVLLIVLAFIILPLAL